MELEVSFEHWSEGYVCLISTKITKPSTNITEIHGHHEEGKSNKDVDWIFFNSSTVHFIPRGLGGFFPNVKILQLSNVGLESICRDDLKEFKNLETLWLSCNRLTTLPDDLFEDTPKLTEFCAYDNKISSMSSKLFDPIINNEFKFINLISNPTIDEFYKPGYIGSVASVDDLMAIIDSQCFEPEPSKPQLLATAHHRIFLKSFENLFDSGKFSDFVINVNSSMQFRVHKVVLATHCGSFTELFEKDPEATEIKIEDLSPEAVEKFLRYLYTGKLDNFEENFMEIFEVAEKLKAVELRDTIENFIVDRIDDFNAFKVLLLALSFKSDKLRSAVFKKIQNNFPEWKLSEKSFENWAKVKKIVETWKELECYLK